jgi:uncharacterized protein
MSRASSIVLLLTGMLLFLGSCAPFGYAIYYESVVDSSQSHELNDIGTPEEFSFNSVPGSLVRFAVEAYVDTPSVQEDPDDFSDGYLARFKFPVKYSVTDSNGNKIIAEDELLAWKGGGHISKSNEEASSVGGVLTAVSRFDKFTVPADGSFNLALVIEPDTTYEADASSIKLHLYEGMIDNTWYVVAGIALLIIGAFTTLAGFIYLIIDATKSNNQQGSDPDVVTRSGESSLDANQRAMFIQLSAFAGYVIPFGSLIVPIILWMIWKDSDEYVDRMGREAVNFQISMMVYYLICIILMFILIGFILIFFVMFFHLIFIIIGTVQTSQGVEYRYPLIIRFIKS